MKIVLLLCITIILNAADTYDEAMQYLEGIKGSIEEKRLMPRCPYERCNGKTTYIHVKKDLKKGYQLLNQAHHEGDLRASAEALNILLKQIDYKSENYDSYLIEKLKENYNLNVDDYNKAVLSFLETLAISNKQEHQCKGSFGLYEANTKAYFGIAKTSEQRLNVADANKKIAISSCSANSLEYLKLTSMEKR